MTASSAAGALRTARAADTPALQQIANAALRWDEAHADEIVDLLWPDEQPGLALVLEEDGAPVGFAFGSLRPAPPDPAKPRRGHVNLIAVHPKARRRGYGTALLSGLEERLAAAGAELVLLGGASPCFAWPGIDMRYTAAMALAESCGFTEHRTAVNMTAELSRPAIGESAADELALAEHGITLRTLRREDEEAIRPWLESWGGTWSQETLSTLRRPRAGCHIAVLHDGAPNAEYIGFAAYGVNLPDWFGPMGTREDQREHGIGRVLLRRCLEDIRASGYRKAQIAWVGPVRFYLGAVDAYVERVFRLYRKEREGKS